MFSKVNLIALLGFMGCFQQYLCPITLTVIINMFTFLSECFLYILSAADALKYRCTCEMVEYELHSWIIIVLKL